MNAGAARRLCRTFLAAATAVLCSCTTQQAVQQNAQSSPTPLPHVAQGTPLFAGAPPAKMLLDGRPLDVDPSGAARYLVRARFEDAAGRPTDLVSGGDVEFVPSKGIAQWQTRLRFGGPAAIVSTFDDGPLTVRVHAEVGPSVPDAKISTDTRTWGVPRVVAKALGPHAVWIGWFPPASRDAVRIERDGDAKKAVVVPPASSHHIDGAVVPGRTARYLISFASRPPAALRVSVPPDLRGGSLQRAFGKSVWLSFSPSTLDDDGYDKLDPGAIVARASAAGLRSVFLRTTYGPFDELTSDDTPKIDAVIDGLAARGIATVAWTVPRSLSFEDLAAESDAAAYRTANGNGFAALAVDLERGEYFLGSGPRGYAALGAYLGLLRAALGPHEPVIATVEDPNLEHLTNENYPFAAIAKDADAIQPMAYWTLTTQHPLSAKGVRAAVAASYAAMQQQAQRKVPIALGFQSAAQGSHAAPSAAEVAAGVAQAKSLGATGVTFFDWTGTQDQTWRAIGSARW